MKIVRTVRSVDLRRKNLRTKQRAKTQHRVGPKLGLRSKAPVNITFNSKERINPQARYQVYSQFMSYEEMVTHSYNVHYFANAVIKNLTIPGVIGNQSKLNDGVRVLLAISENAAISAAKGLELLIDSQNITIEKRPDNGLSYVKISKDDTFELRIFLPEKLIQERDFDVLAFSKNELTRAVQLANFNLKYFSDFRSGQLKDVVPEHARRFRSTQREFFEKH